MRVLFSAVGGEGHLQPLLPLASACAAAGHEVAVAAAASLAPLVTGEGHRFFAARPDVTPQRGVLAPVDRSREDRVVRDTFAGWMARDRCADMTALIGVWRPDVIVRDEMDLGTPVAAEMFDVPLVTVLVIAAGGFARHELIGEPLAALRADHGLPADPGLRMLTRDLVLSPFPPSFRFVHDPMPATARGYATTTMQDRMSTLPFSRVRPGAPLVYVTLGTIFNTESGDLLQRVMQGLSTLPVEALVTTGRGLDPAELGTQPGHVHVLSYVPQADVLPHATAVISHAGSGSVTAALAHGLPMVCLPMGADQPNNAMRCQQLGVGVALDAASTRAQGIQDATARILGSAVYAANARILQRDLRNLPTPAATVAAVEALQR